MFVTLMSSSIFVILIFRPFRKITNCDYWLRYVRLSVGPRGTTWHRLHGFSWNMTFEYQYSETNVMQFLFSLLRIKGLYMFRALLAHPQEALHKRQLVYCMRVMSTQTAVGILHACYVSWLHQDFSGTGAAYIHNTHAVYQLLFMQLLPKMSK
jgi:hypothetical protein